MKHKTSELDGCELDSAVAVALNLPVRYIVDGAHLARKQDAPFDTGPDAEDFEAVFRPSLYWAHGGPILERERICVEFYGTHWGAEPRDLKGRQLPDLSPEKHKQMSDGWCPVMADGPTPLIAAMRAYVASRLGDEVDL